MAQFRTMIRTDLDRELTTRRFSGKMFTQDNKANRIDVALYRNNTEVTAEGEVLGIVKRNDNRAIAFPGGIENGKAYIELPETAYEVEGPISILIRLVSGDEKTVIGVCDAYVTKTADADYVTNGDHTVSIPELLAILDELEPLITRMESVNVEDVNDLTTMIEATSEALERANSIAENSFMAYVENETLYFMPVDGTATSWASVGLPTDEQTAEAVAGWLEDHPEATTSIEDGAISYIKLDSTLKGSIDDVADLKIAMNQAEDAIDSAPVISDDDDSESDLDILDQYGNVLARFENGHIKTKNFDSGDIAGIESDIDALETAAENTESALSGIDNDITSLESSVSLLQANTAETINSGSTGADLDITDGNGNVLARFKGGHVETKNFNSRDQQQVQPTNASGIDLDIADSGGNVLARFEDGHFCTKNFDSDDMSQRVRALEDSSGSGYVVPTYWMNHLTAKEAAINDLNVTLTSGESFIFFTDYHQNTNNGKSSALMRHIVDHTSIRDVIYGGDTTDGGLLPNTAASLAVLRKFANEFRELKIKPARGNHDCEPSAYQTHNQISDAAWYDLMLRPIEKEIVSGNKPYFYFDNENQKIRHIIMDSGGMNDMLTSTQLTWMKGLLTELSSEWTVFIYQHMVVEKTNGEQTVHLITRGTETLNAIGDVYEQLNCTIGAIITGHCHVDAVLETDYNFKIITTTCDAGGANSAYDWNVPTRTEGTSEGQAFDVYSIDTTAKTIYITRIGAGSDRTVTY